MRRRFLSLIFGALSLTCSTNASAQQVRRLSSQSPAPSFTATKVPTISPTCSSPAPSESVHNKSVSHGISFIFPLLVISVFAWFLRNDPRIRDQLTIGLGGYGVYSASSDGYVAQQDAPFELRDTRPPVAQTSSQGIDDEHNGYTQQCGLGGQIVYPRLGKNLPVELMPMDSSTIGLPPMRKNHWNSLPDDPVDEVSLKSESSYATEADNENLSL